MTSLSRYLLLGGALAGLIVGVVGAFLSLVSETTGPSTMTLVPSARPETPAGQSQAAAPAPPAAEGSVAPVTSLPLALSPPTSQAPVVPGALAAARSSQTGNERPAGDHRRHPHRGARGSGGVAAEGDQLSAVAKMGTVELSFSATPSAGGGPAYPPMPPGLATTSTPAGLPSGLPPGLDHRSGALPRGIAHHPGGLPPGLARHSRDLPRGLAKRR